MGAERHEERMVNVDSKSEEVAVSSARTRAVISWRHLIAKGSLMSAIISWRVE